LQDVRQSNTGGFTARQGKQDVGGVCSSTLVIMALTPGRMRTDRVRSLSILPYQHPVFQDVLVFPSDTL
jgi:hypothetical protein